MLWSSHQALIRWFADLLSAIPKSCVYGDVPNGVGKTSPAFFGVSIFSFKIFGRPDGNTGWPIYFYEAATFSCNGGQWVGRRPPGPAYVPVVYFATQHDPAAVEKLIEK